MGKTYKIVMIRCIINHMPYTNLIIIIILIIKRHGDRYTSDYAHFTFSDTIRPLSLSPNFGTQMVTLAETAS